MAMREICNYDSLFRQELTVTTHEESDSTSCHTGRRLRFGRNFGIAVAIALGACIGVLIFVGVTRLHHSDKLAPARRDKQIYNPWAKPVKSQKEALMLESSWTKSLQQHNFAKHDVIVYQGCCKMVREQGVYPGVSWGSAMPGQMGWWSKNQCDTILAKSGDPAGRKCLPKDMCSTYLSDSNCQWTSDWNCPGQARGRLAPATNDGTMGWKCCCEMGLWRKDPTLKNHGQPQRTHHEATSPGAPGETLVHHRPHAAAVSSAPLHQFYMYRATGEGWLDKFPFGDCDVGNLPGVMWYLMNEVISVYTAGPRCPRKFNISRIHRVMVRVRATKQLYNDKKISFGARFAYDFGRCMGRCFPQNMCTGSDDCQVQYDKYGYVVGCNNFRDNYPFPAQPTPAPDGIWYSLPLSGRCAYPTGSTNCTWSYEDAGAVLISELEASVPGNSSCCDGHRTGFWDHQFDVAATNLRVSQALDVFAKRYPAWPRDTDEPICDFHPDDWYMEDPWTPRDPWANNA